jgi:hypothetical protein
MLFLGRDASSPRPVAAVIKITNTGKDNVFLFFYGSLSAD